MRMDGPGRRDVEAISISMLRTVTISLSSSSTDNGVDKSREEIAEDTF